MNLINEYNEKYRFFHNITGCAMLVHRKYKPGCRFLKKVDSFRV